jgi:magnesium and cobalt transporter
MDELLFHIGDSGDAGVISAVTTTLAKRAVELKDLRVADILIDLEQTVMVDYESTREDFRDTFEAAGYSRLPVYRDRRENVVGVLSVHELLKFPGRDAIREQLRAPYTVGIDSPIVDVLIEMKEHGRHMAIVVDDGGRVAGMTTLEDILEKFVGAIADEFN